MFKVTPADSCLGMDYEKNVHSKLSLGCTAYYFN